MIGGVVHLPFDGHVAQMASHVQVTAVARTSAMDHTQWIWGDPHDGTGPLRTDLAITCVLAGRTIHLSPSVLSGIATIDPKSIRGYWMAGTLHLSFSGGDAGGSWDGILEQSGTTARRYCRGGEFREQTCEYAEFLGDVNIRTDTHEDWDPNM